MILLATNRRDMTTDFVVLELRRRQIDFVRLNTEDLATYEMEMPDGDPARLILRTPIASLEIDGVTSGYYRRPGRPEPDEPSEAIASYIAAEWSAVLRCLWNVLEDKWLNSPFAILRAEDKPRQLAAARRAGFKVPDTLVTNAFDAARSFVEHGATVGKTLRHALIDDDEHGSVIFTSRVEGMNPDDAASVRRAPIMLQREIAKQADLRVVVVDDRVFATMIESQVHEETQVDWRRGTRLDLRHEPVTLPVDAMDACRTVTNALGLRFAAIDLVEDLSGDLWFLEANPNGQWAWIEQRTGAPITAAIVDGLTR